MAARDTISHALFVWLVAVTIGAAHLHHVVTGSLELFGGLWAGTVDLSDLARFLTWTTLGNIGGGVLFAVLVRYSVLQEHSDTSHSGSQGAQPRGSPLPHGVDRDRRPSRPREAAPGEG